MTVKTEVLEILMQQALRGDQVAYADLLKQSAMFLRPYLSKRLHDAAEVDDVLQETLISIHKAKHTYDGQRPYKPWAYAIARFRLNDYLRQHYRDDLRHAEDIAELEHSLDTGVTESEFNYESIHAAVQTLPAKQANILQLMHQKGYTAKEVAEKTGMNVSAVKVAAFRAYQQLRKILDK